MYIVWWMRLFQAAHALNSLLLEHAIFLCGMLEHVHCSTYKSIIEVTSSLCQLSRSYIQKFRYNWRIRRSLRCLSLLIRIVSYSTRLLFSYTNEMSSNPNIWQKLTHNPAIEFIELQHILHISIRLYNVDVSPIQFNIWLSVPEMEIILDCYDHLLR